MENNELKKVRLTIEYEKQDKEIEEKKIEVREVQSPKRIDTPIMVEGNRQLLND